MAQPTALDHDAVLRRFRQKLEECTKVAVCNRPYVLVEKLQEWLRSPAPPATTTQAGCLLHAAYRNRRQPGLPITLSDFVPSRDCCLLVFGILLAIDCGERLHRITESDKVDSDLPLRWETVQDIFSDSEQQALSFFQMQWRFCPHKFDLYKSKTLRKGRVVPVCWKEPIKEGGTAHLWHIAVPEEFVMPSLRKAVSDSRVPAGPPGSETEEWGYEFALKTYKEGNRLLYNNEKDALIGLKGHEGMVRWLADFSQEDARRPSRPPEPDDNQELEESGVTTHNILLEFGEMDLDVLFGDRLPPVIQSEIEQFWISLFRVANAVEGIHHLKINSAGVVQEFHGWHSDIKPDNILILKDKYKLADPGFARFQRIQTTQKGRLPEECYLGGTETYGAPECHPGRHQTLVPVPQTIDIWSLACVFSVAATWVALDYQGVLQYNRVREMEIRDIVQSQSRNNARRKPVLSEGDYFHDGRDVLSSVRDWHQYLRSLLRPTDTFTARVLDLVDEQMLLGNGQARISAKGLCRELRGIIQQAQAQPRTFMSEKLQSALLRIEEGASPRTAELKPPEVSPQYTSHLAVPVKESREARKSRLLGRATLTTSHRKSALSVRGPDADLPNVIYESPKGTEDSFTLLVPELKNGAKAAEPPRFALNAPNRPTAHQRTSSETTALSPPPQIQRARTARVHTPQNVFQARAEIKEREKGNYLGKLRKDKLLEQHCRDRDFKFLVDNGDSMIPNWFETTYLLETLVQKAAGQDENGMDLAFTFGPIKVNGKKKAAEFVKAMKDARPEKGMHTDMKHSLGEIFDDYFKEVETKARLHQKVKNMTLIILTDGMWQGMRNKNDVDQKIISFVKELGRRVREFRHRPFSIEFIQFGHDEDATFKLRSLDSHLKWKGIPDVIDTEHSSGDTNKMLLGSFVEEFDYDDDDLEEEDVSHSEAQDWDVVSNPSNRR